MKKIVLLLIFMISFLGYSQELKVGLTLAPTISFNKHFVKVDKNWEATDGSGGLGWKGGLLADYQFSGNYYVHSGLLIHSKNFDNKIVDQSLTTVEIPLALKLRSNEVADNIHITGFFGGTLDFNVAAKTKSDGKVIQNLDQFRKLGSSFMVGAGAEYDLDFGSIGLGLSYHLGLTNISSVDNYKVIPKHLSIDLVFYF